MQKIRNVGELKSFLETRGLSPEGLARKVPISNMTIRRLLSRGQAAEIPAKYHAQFDHLLETDRKFPLDVKSLFGQLKATGRERLNDERVLPTVYHYLTHCRMGDVLKPLVEGLEQVARNPKRKSHKALVIGALVYLLNPFDLIPDVTVVTGFLDDFAILSLVEEWIASRA